jgi:hypothetical protein
VAQGPPTEGRPYTYNKGIEAKPMTLTQLLTAIAFLFICFLCLVVNNNGDVKKAAEDFADAFADGIDQAINTNKK